MSTRLNDIKTATDYIYEVVIHMNDFPFVIYSQGTCDFDIFFNNVYHSNKYSPEFWKSHFEKKEISTLISTSTYETRIGTSYRSHGSLIALVSSFDQFDVDYSVIIFVSPDELVRHFLPESSYQPLSFALVGEDLQTVFNNSDMSNTSIRQVIDRSKSSLNRGEASVRIGPHYVKYDGTSPADIVDGVRQIDFNRNWPIQWKAASNASSYPFSEPETRAVGDFLLDHPNIFAGIDLHFSSSRVLWARFPVSGCAIMRPTSRPASEIDQGDLELIIDIGKTASEIIGFRLIHERNYKPPWKKPLSLPGTSNDFAYDKFGISHFIVELGGIRRGEGYYMWPPVLKEIAPRVGEFFLHHAVLRPK